MFAMRLKIGSIRNNEWRCCFCLHVRTATIAFGIWHLVLHVLALTILALIMRNHNIFVQKQEEFEQNDFLPTPLSKIKDDDNPYYLPTTQDGRPILPSDIDMGALLTICTLSITLLMVYGTIKGKPRHLLPFFFLQLFDFAITTLTATGYFCYLRSVHRLVAEHWHNLPFRQELLSLSPQYLSLLVLTSFLVSMIWKAYWIGVIWRCYKYLTLKQQATHNTIHYILPSEGADRTDTDYPSLFRDHESGFGPLKQTPPPSYQDVMDDQPPPYPATTTIVQETPTRFLFTYSPEDGREGQDDSTSSEASLKSENNVSVTITPEDLNAASTSGLQPQSPKNEEEAEILPKVEAPNNEEIIPEAKTDDQASLKLTTSSENISKN